MARTLTSRMDAVEANIGRILALLEGDSPRGTRVSEPRAKVTQTRSHKTENGFTVVQRLNGCGHWVNNERRSQKCHRCTYKSR
jgi:hypothetical protein